MTDNCKLYLVITWKVNAHARMFIQVSTHMDGYK